MEKRVLLAVALSFVVLYGYQAMFPPPKPAPAARPRATAGAGAPAAGRAAGSTAAGSRGARAPAAGRAARRPTPPSATSSSRTPTCTRCSPTAARALKSWRLKHYTDRSGAAARARAADRPRTRRGRSRCWSTTRQLSATLRSAHLSSRAPMRLTLGAAAGDADVRLQRRRRVCARARSSRFEPAQPVRRQLHARR